MTISEKLLKINDIKGDIRDALNQKGIQVDESAPFDSYPRKVATIPQSVINMLPAPEGMYSISTGTNDESKGTVEGTCVVSENAIVTVKATPADAGYALEGWYEDDEFVSGERKYRFVVDRDRQLLAKFGDAYIAGRDWFTSTVSGVSLLSAYTYCAVYGNGIFLSPAPYTGGANNFTRISDDGITWTGTVFDGSSGERGPYHFAAFDGQDFIVVSDSGQVSRANLPEHYYRSIAKLNVAAIVGFYYISETGIYMVVDQRKILISTDRTAWVEVNLNGMSSLSSNVKLINCVYYNGRYLAVTNVGTLFESEDALSWDIKDSTGLDTVSPSSSSAYYKCMGDANGVLVLFRVASPYSYIYRSVDFGDTWEKKVMTFRVYDPIRIQSDGNDCFVIVYSTNSSSGIIGALFSVDGGITWDTANIGDGDYADNIVYGNGTFVTVGSQPSAWRYSRSRGPVFP